MQYSHTIFTTHIHNSHTIFIIFIILTELTVLKVLTKLTVLTILIGKEIVVRWALNFYLKKISLMSRENHVSNFSLYYLKASSFRETFTMNNTTETLQIYPF